MREAPHAPLRGYYGEEHERARWVRELFDRTAADYDRIERAMALGCGSWYRRRALAGAGLTAGMKVLDIGTGTGLTARQAARLAGPAGEVTGIDPSAGMLQSARLPAGVRLLRGMAEAIPAAGETIDFLCMGYALRHVDDLTVALGEFRRVLKAGGRLCLLEITAPDGRAARSALKLYLRGVVPLMSRCMAAHRDMPQLMRYYWDTIEACLPPQRILAVMREAGFVEVERRVDLGIFSAYRGCKPR